MCDCVLKTSKVEINLFGKREKEEEEDKDSERRIGPQD